MEKKIEHYDVVIIGGGAAGMTAGIYCGRAKLKTLIIEKALLGGLATYTNEIENYPGFPEGSTGLGLEPRRSAGVRPVPVGGQHGRAVARARGRPRRQG